MDRIDLFIAMEMLRQLDEFGFRSNMDRVTEDSVMYAVKRATQIEEWVDKAKKNAAGDDPDEDVRAAAKAAYAVKRATQIEEWVDKAKKKIQEDRLAAEAERLEKEAAIKAAWEGFFSRTREVADGWEHLTVEGRREAFIQFVMGMLDQGCVDLERYTLAAREFRGILREAVGLFPEARHILMNFISADREGMRLALLSFLDRMDRN